MVNITCTCVTNVLFLDVLKKTAMLKILAQSLVQIKHMGSCADFCFFSLKSLFALYVLVLIYFDAFVGCNLTALGNHFEGIIERQIIKEAQRLVLTIT